MGKTVNIYLRKKNLLIHSQMAQATYRNFKTSTIQTYDKHGKGWRKDMSCTSFFKLSLPES